MAHIGQSRRRHCGSLSVVLMLAGVLCAPAASAGPFDRGSAGVSIVLGSSSAFNEDYLVLGVGIGYYVARGLELALQGEAWLDADPDIYKVAPSIRYVIDTKTQLSPYVGAFYRRAFIDGFDDIDSTGARAGVYWLGGGRWYFGAGLVYEKLRDCEERIYVECDDTYPEFIFAATL